MPKTIVGVESPRVNCADRMCIYSRCACAYAQTLYAAAGLAAARFLGLRISMLRKIPSRHAPNA